MLLCGFATKKVTNNNNNFVSKTDLAFLAPTVESSNEEDAESAESGMAPDSMPRGPMHWAATFKKIKYFSLITFVGNRDYIKINSHKSSAPASKDRRERRRGKSKFPILEN